ncbi:hypothetical protein MXF40_09045 [Serratia marcescens]|uniref:hypothetical protein n=1 Tax=Serratia marcescens TaxID=615 RepID=UPI002DB79740|nr:hypothetical protein [Serratia marcescens]MEB6081524.1 hypothetical protein [Serratia marcescens]
MITIKRYNPDAAMSISREHAWMRETPEGGHVEYGDYASLFAQFELVKAERDALADRVNALAVEIEALKDVLENICCRDNEPEYHDCGMGCGLEDRGITDRYAAMAHGWESAMERIYEEVIPFIDDLPETPATDAALAVIQAQGVEKFADFLDSPIDGQHCYQNEVGLARHFASTLREAK